MAAYFHDDVIDAALDELDGANALHICSGTPTDRASVTSLSLATIVLDAGDYTTSNATPNGRGLTVAAQTGVDVVESGTPTYYCLVDDLRLLAMAEVDDLSPDLTDGSTTNLPVVEFSIADPITV